MIFIKGYKQHPEKQKQQDKRNKYINNLSAKNIKTKTKKP